MMVWLEGPRLGVGGCDEERSWGHGVLLFVWLQRNHSRTNSRATQLLSLSLSLSLQPPSSRHQRPSFLPQQHRESEREHGEQSLVETRQHPRNHDRSRQALRFQTLSTLSQTLIHQPSFLPFVASGLSAAWCFQDVFGL